MTKDDFTAADLRAVLNIIDNIDDLDPELDHMTINRQGRVLGNIRKTDEGWIYRPYQTPVDTGNYLDR